MNIIKRIKSHLNFKRIEPKLYIYIENSEERLYEVVVSRLKNKVCDMGLKVDNKIIPRHSTYGSNTCYGGGEETLKYFKSTGVFMRKGDWYKVSFNKNQEEICKELKIDYIKEE